ncbi:MAG: hypothetical protein OEW26_04300 [Nitrospirota bacterium]|nr:hypothetical protein [Nitrospirota bacterium]
MAISGIEVGHFQGDTPLKENISVGSVSGGEGTNPLWTSEIGNEDFRQALVQSLQAAKLLNWDEKKAPYTLNTKMIRIEQDIFGLDLEVIAIVQYTLIDKTTEKEIFSTVIYSPYTATFSDAFWAFERLKLANEGSARANITKMIKELYKLEIGLT